MAVIVTPYSPEWPGLFDRIAAELQTALTGVPVVGIEHVGSTSVPGLVAKPIIDVDVIVRREDVPAAVGALEAAGYVHRGDLGLVDREAFFAPDDGLARHVYLCVDGTLQVRAHVAVRDALRADAGLRDRYAAVKAELSADPSMDIDRYIAGKSDVLQDVLAVSSLTEDEKRRLYALNTAV
ncbi:GrpB family protein [Microbacterium bovistercoris]|uniref:GrpB family protein n=1 Tax=Microbacterium bovistercoris TaxID=2293570 RepID=A0A371NSE9_9MICO|nr:GrpB family protein [Microbacterium bovistercoris]REJ04677.1 GrpB family protein [Microbacterium bovistercoris]